MLPLPAPENGMMSVAIQMDNNGSDLETILMCRGVYSGRVKGGGDHMDQFNIWDTTVWAHVRRTKNPDEWIVEPVESGCSEFTIVASDESDKRDKIEKELRRQLRSS